MVQIVLPETNLGINTSLASIQDVLLFGGAGAKVSDLRTRTLYPPMFPTIRVMV